MAIHNAQFLPTPRQAYCVLRLVEKAGACLACPARLDWAENQDRLLRRRAHRARFNRQLQFNWNGIRLGRFLQVVLVSFKPRGEQDPPELGARFQDFLSTLIRLAESETPSPSDSSSPTSSCSQSQANVITDPVLLASSYPIHLPLVVLASAYGALADGWVPCITSYTLWTTLHPPR